MVSNRIKTIASLIDKSDRILDIGTDHALLPIYLVQNNLVSKADGSDISRDVLKNAIDNVNKYRLENVITIYLSDGVKNIDISSYNTLVITGMGFYTIKDILDNANLNDIRKLVIQSNNNLPDLRKYLNNINYKITNEVCIKDKGKNYTLVTAEPGKQILNEAEILCGLYKKENIWFYKENINKLNNILKKIKHTSKKDEVTKLIDLYSSYIIKEKTED